MTAKHTGLVTPASTKWFEPLCASMDEPQPAFFSPSPQPQAVLTYNYQYAAQFDATLAGRARPLAAAVEE
jgi:hypothetical protein